MLTKTLHLCCSRLKPPPQTTPQQSQNTLHIPSFKNFNSLYDPTSDSDTLTGFGSGSTSQQTLTSTDDVVDASDSEPEPDLSTVIASRRLTRPASTGRSNSIVDGDVEGEERVGFGAVPTMSPDPYGDFKRSIEEMVAALGILEKHGRRRSGDHHRRRRELSGAQQRRLQELLLCYLALNGKSAHKYIVGAFAEVVRGLGGGA